RRRNVPVCRDLYKERGFKPNELRKISDLQALPIFTKSDYRKCEQESLRVLYHDHLEAVRHYQLVQETANRINVLVAPGEGWDEASRARLRSDLKRLLVMTCKWSARFILKNPASGPSLRSFTTMRNDSLVPETAESETREERRLSAVSI